MPGFSLRVRIFYGWRIVAASAIILMVNAGMTFYAFGVFLTPVTREFDWTRAEFSGAIALAYLVTGIASLLAGKLSDRFGARRAIVASALITGGSFVMLSLTQSLWYFYLIFLIQAASRTGAHIIPVTTLMANWFQEKRGLAMGIVVTGISVGGVIITPLATYLIGLFGWRISYIVLGALIWITGIPLAIIVIRNRPQHLGLLPYGQSPFGGAEGQQPRLSRSHAEDNTVWTVTAALKTSTFHLGAAALALLYMGGAAMMTHTIPRLIDRGVSADGAALVLSFVAGMGIPGKTLSGYLADRFQARFVVLGISFLMALSIFILLNSSAGASLWLFALVFGTSYGGVITMQSYLVAHWFGLASLGAIMGAMAVISNAGFAVGPVVGGYVFDVTGNYDFAFQVFIATSLLAGLLVFFTRPPRLK